MTNDTAFTLVQPVLDRLEKEGDPFMFVHFSRSEDKFRGRDIGMDKLDVILVIKKLIKKHNIDTDILKGILT